jgi:hypothetical protein
VEWFEAAQFWSQVKVGPKWLCWEWQGRKNEKGYGYIWCEKAHRVAYSLAKGPIPAGALILHECDNRACCNPAHLRVGSAKENARDMVDRGRHRSSYGLRNGNGKLTDSQVAEILASPEKGVALARRFEVSESTVSMIRNRRRRLH